MIEGIKLYLVNIMISDYLHAYEAYEEYRNNVSSTEISKYLTNKN